MNKKLKSSLKIGIPILLGVLLVWYSLSKISINELLAYFKKANYYWVTTGVLLGVLSHLSRAYRWKFLIEPLGHKLRLGNSIMAVFAAYLINYTIPRAGEISRATIVANYDDIPFEKGFGTIVSERIADLLMMLVIIAITLFIEFDFIYNHLTQNIEPQKLIIGIALLVILGIVGLLFLKKSKHQLAVKIRSLLNGFIEGVLSIFKMEKKVPFILHTLFIWIMYVAMFYVTSLSLSELNAVPMGAILIGFIAASFSIAATNGGIGSYPEAIVLAFAIFSIPEDPSRAFGWIMWSSQTAMIVLLGGLSIILLPFYNRNRNKDQKED